MEKNVTNAFQVLVKIWTRKLQTWSNSSRKNWLFSVRIQRASTRPCKLYGISSMYNRACHFQRHGNNLALESCYSRSFRRKICGIPTARGLGLLMQRGKVPSHGPTCGAERVCPSKTDKNKTRFGGSLLVARPCCFNDCLSFIWDFLNECLG